MRYLIGLAAGCALGLWTAVSAVHAGPGEDCNQAIRNPDLAIQGCSELIRRNPRDPVSYRARGTAYMLRGHHDRALADLDEAIRLDPNSAGAYFDRGLVHLFKGDHDRAIADLSEAIRLNPRDALAYQFRSTTYRAKGDYERSIADLNEVIKRNPHDAVGYVSRGGAYLAKGDYDRAIADANEAIRLSPNIYVAYSYRGAAYSAKGDYDRAIADLNEAIKLNARGTLAAIAYIHRGTAYARKGDYDRALTDHNEAIRLDPGNSIAFARRGQTLEAKGERARAIEDYNRALALPANTRQDRDEQATVAKRLAALQAAPPATASLGRRVALVIGNAGYKIGPLENPANDAAAVAEALRGTLKFDKVVLKLNLGAEGFRAALREFSRESAGAGLGLVYFAGHGTEVNGKNFLIPVDAALAKAGDLNLEAIPLDTVLEQLAGVTKLKLVILDACRNNIFPLAGAVRSASRGLSRIEPAENTLVVYAAKDGTTADDGVGRRHSPFTEALLKHISTPGLELRFLLGEVRDDVLAATGRAQQPYVYGTLGRTRIYLRR